MRILVITKRVTNGKDLIRDQYGRAYRLARSLSRAEHKVSGIAIGYRGEDELFENGIDSAKEDVPWHGLTMQWHKPWQLVSRIMKLIDEWNPDILWASGDALQIILATHLARRSNTRVVSDLKDNYEAFWPTRIPGVFQAYQRAVRNSDGVTCVSQLLAAHIKGSLQPNASTAIIPNGVNLDDFGSILPSEARSRLGLPMDGVLVGTAGSLRAGQGFNTLLKAFSLVRSEIPSAVLALAGPLDRGRADPEGGGIAYLGQLPHENIPYFLKALDVGIILNRDTRFGRYCFPLKLPEMLAARIPIVAADVGATANLFRQTPQFLFDPDNPHDLAAKIIHQLRYPQIYPKEPASWDSIARDLAKYLASTASQPSRSLKL